MHIGGVGVSTQHRATLSAQARTWSSLHPTRDIEVDNRQVGHFQVKRREYVHQAITDGFGCL